MFKKGKPQKNFPKFYDSHINITIPYYILLHAEIIHLVKAAALNPAIWLDTGCGTGTLVASALDEFPQTRFILADPAPEMIEEARKKLERVTPQRVLFQDRCKTQDIELAGNEKPDVITAVLCHHYLDEKDRKEATVKCFELLRPGGFYITFENIRPFTAEGIAIGKANWKNFQMASGKTSDDAESHIQRFGVEYFPITIEEHLVLLRNTGFSVVELFWFSYLQAGFYCIK